MAEIRIRYILPLTILLSFTLQGASRQTTRPDPADPVHPFDTPPPVAHAHHRGAMLVGGAADQFDARGTGGDHEHQGEVSILNRDQSMMRDECIVSERRSRCDDLGTADADACICLFGNMDVDVT